MKDTIFWRELPGALTGLIVLALSSLLLAGSIHARGIGSVNFILFPAFASGYQAQSSNAEAPTAVRIPSGTILPMVLRTSVSFGKCKAGQILHGKLAQDVLLPSGSKIRKGSVVEGHIVSVIPNANGTGSQVTMQFDKVYVAGQWVPVTTDLRAIAGFMAIQAAQTPDEAPSEGSPYNWLPKTQVGGDSVYGVGGPVMSAEDTSKVIGKSVGDGVLVPASAKEGTKCRGEMNGNDSLQAMWVFSSDACGAYGIEHLTITHAGRTAPKGIIVLASDVEKLSLRNGDVLLLRVN
jgi:hypothetical protein